MLYNLIKYYHVSLQILSGQEVLEEAEVDDDNGFHWLLRETEINDLRTEKKIEFWQPFRFRSVFWKL